FFSSRRRHTRSKRDWSSDVCSSDLLFDGQVAFHQCQFLFQSAAAFAAQGGAKQAGQVFHRGFGRLRVDADECGYGIHAVEQEMRSEERRVGKRERVRGISSSKKISR